MKYRKKPVVIDAIRYIPDSPTINKLAEFMGGSVQINKENKVVIQTLEGELTGSPGDFIIKGIKGEFYACKPDIFYQTYEKVEQQ